MAGRVHYDALAQAVPQAKETTFVSEWLGSRPDGASRHVVSRGVLASGGVMPAFTGHEVTFVSEWIGSKPDLPTRHVQSVSPGGGVWPAFSGHEVNFVSEWFQRTPDFPTRHVQSVVPSGSQVPTFTGPEVVFADRWFHQQPDSTGILKPLAVVPSGAVWPAFSGSEVVYPDKWWHQQPEPIRLVSPTTLLPSGSQEPTFTGREVVGLSDWFHQQPDPANVLQVEPVVPSGAVLSSYNGPEIVYPDKWFHEQPDPQNAVAVRSVVPSGSQVPTFTGHEIVLVSEWQGNRPDGALREVRRVVDLSQYVLPPSGALEQSAPLAAAWAFNQPHSGKVVSTVPWGITAWTPQTIAAVVAPSVSSWAFELQPQPPAVKSVVPSGSQVPTFTAHEVTTPDRWLGSSPSLAIQIVPVQPGASVYPIQPPGSVAGWVGYWPQPVPQPSPVQIAGVTQPILAPVPFGWYFRQPDQAKPFTRPLWDLPAVPFAATIPPPPAAPLLSWSGRWPTQFPLLATSPALWTSGAVMPPLRLPASVATRFIQWFLIGGSSNDDNQRRINLYQWGLRFGWARFRELWVNPLLDAGCKRIAISNPFGYTTAEINAQGGNFPLGAFITVNADPNFAYLVSDFVATWRTVTALGVEVIAYLGGLQTLASGSWQAAIQACLDAGMSLAFDNQSTIVNAQQKAFLDGLKAGGTRVYVEERPGVGTGYTSYNWIMEGSPGQDRYDIALNDPAFVSLSDPGMTGERVLIVDVPPPGVSYDWNLVPWVDSRLALGDRYSVATDVLKYLAEGGATLNPPPTPAPAPSDQWYGTDLSGKQIILQLL